MAITIANGFFNSVGGSITFREPLYIAPILIGQIIRAVNVTGTAATYTYTDVNGAVQTSPSIASASIEYLYAQSGSMVDQFQSASIAVTSLIITSSNFTPSPTFTEVLLTTIGAGSWTKPAGVTEVIVECWGGGGAGGGAIDNPAAGGGGGGGQYSRKYLQYTSPSVSISYQVGAAGTASTGAGTDGGDSTWELTPVVIAKGGTGGAANGSLTNGSAFGGVGNTAGSLGDIIYLGGDGNFGYGVNGGVAAVSGGGGGGAGSVSVGKTSNSDKAGALTQEKGGAGGDGLLNIAGNGSPASVYGGGGGGACAVTNTNRSGGNGAQGLIRIIYR